MGVKDNIPKMRKKLEIYKNYGTSFYKICSKAFINYILIIVSLFKATIFRSKGTFILFYGFVLQL